MISHTSLRVTPALRIAAAAAAVLLGGISAHAADAQPPPRAAAPAPGAPSATGFETFRFIGTWNIFNPNRVGHPDEGPPPPQIETISLVGTMQYDKGVFAFFDSADRNYRQALHEGDEIAQFKITHITADRVDFVRDSKPVSLAVGQQFRRPPGGEWTVAAAIHEEKAPTAVAEPAIPSDANNILKKLMEQRLKQLKQ
jgi:hypothetical protein